MSDAPLSRRARRTFEEEAADLAALQDPTSGLVQASASAEFDAAEAARAALSRRDRRRMERLNHPLEAWTAEEEMLATGQIPVMTPERIAEQERISRAKADSAAQEAIAASQEFRRLAEAEIRQAPPALAEPVSPWLPSQPPVFQEPAVQEPAVQEPVVQAPAYQQPAFQQPAFQAPAPQAPADEPQWAQETPADFPGDFEYATPPTWPEEDASPVQTPPGFALPESLAAPLAAEEAASTHEAGTHEAATREDRPVLEAYQPVMALDDAPLLPVVHPVHHPLHDEAPADAQAEADAGGADERASQRADILDALFPPGSSQTALRQLDPFATGSLEEPALTASGHIPTLLPPQEVPERATNPVDEIRRLAAEAMSGIERASRADEEAAAGSTRDPSVSAEFDSLPSASAPPAVPQNTSPENYGYNGQRPTAAQPPTPQAPPISRPLAEFAWAEEAGSGPSASQPAANPTFDSAGDWSQRAEPVPATPKYADFDQLTQPYGGSAYGSAPASGQFPMPGQQGQPASGQFPMPGQQGQPASGQFPMPGQQSQPAPQGLAGPQGPAWNSQPLNVEPGRAAEAQAFTPLSNVPKPDFSGLYQQASPSAFPPLTGAINTAALNAAEFHGGDMSASGQTPAIRRPDLPEVGGVKHFKWLHLSVIGALMFVLGVVIYNVAFNK